MKRNLVTTIVTLALLGLSAPAFAQTDGMSPAAAPSSSSSSSGGAGFDAGDLSISLGIPGGGNPYAAGTFGLWYAFTGNMNFGINVGFGLDTAPIDDVFNLLLAPALKYHLMPDSEVQPFFIGQLNLGFTSVGDDAVDLGILGGFGAEWFVTEEFSLAGYTGIGVDILRPNDTDPIRIGTFTSGFSGQIYW